MDQIAEMAVAGTDEMVRGGFGVQPPTVHVLIDGLDPGYVGYLTCRPFYRGRDAEGAVAAMGLLGSQLAVSRLVSFPSYRGGLHYAASGLTVFS